MTGKLKNLKIPPKQHLLVLQSWSLEADSHVRLHGTKKAKHFIFFLELHLM